jgi:hypothetical protein
MLIASPILFLLFAYSQSIVSSPIMPYRIMTIRNMFWGVPASVIVGAVNITQVGMMTMMVQGK